MARGWESKSVEEQKEASAQAAPDPQKHKAVNAQAERALANLRLARSQAAQALSAASNLRYRQQLEQALAELDARIAAQTKSTESG